MGVQKKITYIARISQRKMKSKLQSRRSAAVYQQKRKVQVQSKTSRHVMNIERLTMTALLSKHAVIMDPCIFFFYSHLPEAQIYKCKNLTFKVLLR